MRRRSYLAVAASALSTAVAGCTSAGDRDADPVAESTTNSATTATTETVTPSTPAVSTSIQDVVLQPAALDLNVDYLTVRDDGQYLFAQATVEEGTAELEEYALRIDGETHQPLTGHARRRLWRMREAREYAPDSGGLVAFELPGSIEAVNSTAVLAHPGGEYRLDAELRKRLTATPEFAVDLSVPETVAADGSLSVTVTVTNGGDSPARFVGGLNRYGPRVASTPVEAIRPLVPAGESATRAIDQTRVLADTSDEEVGDGESDVKFSLYTPARSEQRSVRVVDSA
jgi:hypothetical protein